MKLSTGVASGLRALAVSITTIGFVACGGGGGTPTTSANEMASALDAPSTPLRQSAALAPGASLAAEYTVVNLGGYGWLGPKSINATGQVGFSAYTRTSSQYKGYFYNGATVQPLDIPNSYEVLANGVNETGQVAGFWHEFQGPDRAFSWSPTGPTTGVVTDLGTLGGTRSSGMAINNSGQVAGYATTSAGNQAFLWSPTSGMTSLGTLGGLDSFAVDVNNSGQVTGHLNSSSQSTPRAFLWSPTAGMRDLGALGTGTFSFGRRINDAGQVAGAAQDSNSIWHPVRWSPTGVITDLGSLGGTHGEVFAFNNAGQAAGYSQNSSSAYHAFIWSETNGMVDLGTLGGPHSFARAMNNLGQVVGDAYVTDSVVSAFAWTAMDGMVDLNTRIPSAPAGVVLYQALAVSDNGSIVASASTGVVLLKPGATSSSAPTVGAITASGPGPVASAVTVSASFTDADSADTHTATWNWGDGTTSQVGAVSQSSPVVASHAYTAAGVYQVTLQVTDNTGQTAQVSREVVVYDPSAGSVSGGGWIMSPVGAYKADPTLSGQASFAFVSKYVRGANKPSGKADFQFQAANLNFHSENYDWLVVAGTRAQYRGSGTINGSGAYKFLLTAVDGSTRGGGSDRFRIRIWHYDAQAKADVVVYDNQVDTGGEGALNEGTVIAGGNIVIQSR